MNNNKSKDIEFGCTSEDEGFVLASYDRNEEVPFADRYGAVEPTTDGYLVYDYIDIEDRITGDSIRKRVPKEFVAYESRRVYERVVEYLVETVLGDVPTDVPIDDIKEASEFVFNQAQDVAEEWFDTSEGDRV